MRTRYSGADRKTPTRSTLVRVAITMISGGRASRVTSVDKFRDNGLFFGQSDDCIQVA